jgi:hypothetical protein
MAQPMNPYDELPPERPGMSGGTKVLLTLGIGCGVFAVLCCGALGVGIYMGVQMFRSSITNDPPRVQSIAEEICEIEIPEALSPTIACDVTHYPLIGQVYPTWAVFTDAGDESFLALGQFSELLGSDEDMQSRFRDALRQSRRKEWEEVEIAQSEVREREIRGEPARFRISQGVGRDTHNEYWQAEGRMRGKGGPAVLRLRLKSPAFTKDDAIKVIDSIK